MPHAPITRLLREALIEKKSAMPGSVERGSMAFLLCRCQLEKKSLSLSALYYKRKAVSECGQSLGKEPVRGKAEAREGLLKVS